MCDLIVISEIDKAELGIEEEVISTWQMLGTHLLFMQKKMLVTARVKLVTETVEV